MDISLYYKEKGNGIPFVLLHGNGENGEYFKHQIDYFSNNYRMIAVDTRGHGKSPRGNAPFTMEQFAEVIILGFSDGANIAMKYAIKYPERIKALILNGGNLNTTGVKKFTQFLIEANYKFKKAFSKISEGAKRKAEIWGLMVNEPNIKIEEIQSIKTPTLIIVGNKDMIKESHSREIAENIPDARLSIIKGDHFIAEKEPKAFNRAVEKFLSETQKES